MTTKNKEYGDNVNLGIYSDDINVPLDPPFKDNRGIIQNLWLSNSGSITFIESKQGAERAKHIHIDDWHATYIISGKVKYIEIINEIKKETIFSANDMFFTKPNVYHIMEFLEDTKMITINNISKSHDNYEKSIIRK